MMCLAEFELGTLLVSEPVLEMTAGSGSTVLTMHSICKFA